MHRPSSSTMSDSFHTHGLIGIDLHYAQDRRTAQLGTSLPRQSAWTGMRRALATFCIAAGTMLAGKEVLSPTEGQPAT